MIFVRFRGLFKLFRRRELELTPTFLKFCRRKLELAPYFCPNHSKRYLQTYDEDLPTAFPRLRNTEFSVKLKSKHCKVFLITPIRFKVTSFLLRL